MAAAKWNGTEHRTPKKVFVRIAHVTQQTPASAVTVTSFIHCLATQPGCELRRGQGDGLNPRLSKQLGPILIGQ